MKTDFLGRATACMVATALLAIGCNPGTQGSHVASVSGRVPSDAKAAAQFAAMGVAAIRARNGAQAVMMAERAVALAPRDGRYRAQLGQSYLLAGRFASAIDAFRDTIALAPGDGRAMLGMALAQGALERRDGVRQSIAAAAGRIGDADRGLALALAGESGAAIALLEPAARATGAAPKTRQNLALAYALAGRWDVARSTAAQDLSAADLDARMAQWARLAGPQPQVDRIATFLNVLPATVDDGMPVQLALSAVPVLPVAAAPAMLAASAPVSAPVSALVSAPVVPQLTAAAPATAMPTLLIPAPDMPVRMTTVQSVAYVRALPMPTPVVGPYRAASPRPVAPPALLMRAVYAPPVRGQWAVQLGAYASGRSIEATWTRISGRVRPVAGMQPLTSTIRMRGQLFQRLAVGGIATRADAVALCEQVRVSGGDCFVRGTTDEAPIRYAAAGSALVRVASR